MVDTWTELLVDEAVDCDYKVMCGVLSVVSEEKMWCDERLKRCATTDVLSVELVVVQGALR